jgi:hypothetical protein
VIRVNRDTGERGLSPLQWDLVPFWAKDPKIAYSTINADGGVGRRMADAAPARRTRALMFGRVGGPRKVRLVRSNVARRPRPSNEVCWSAYG